jgi:hypothetical protein
MYKLLYLTAFKEEQTSSVSRRQSNLDFPYFYKSRSFTKSVPESHSTSHGASQNWFQKAVLQAAELQRIGPRKPIYKPRRFTKSVPESHFTSRGASQNWSPEKIFTSYGASQNRFPKAILQVTELHKIGPPEPFSLPFV